VDRRAFLHRAGAGLAGIILAQVAPPLVRDPMRVREGLGGLLLIEKQILLPESWQEWGIFTQHTGGKLLERRLENVFQHADYQILGGQAFLDRFVIRTAVGG
jgi:hypothetical protein